MLHFKAHSQGTLESINVSEKKGVCKTPIQSVDVDGEGIVCDAHRGKWHRQISLMSLEDIEAFSAETKQSFEMGIFAENLTLRGIQFSGIRLFDRLQIGDCLLEISQLGKACHGGACAVRQRVGVCIVPKKGIFGRVLKTGKISQGDECVYFQKIWKAKVVVMSDRAFAGEYEDRSGELALQKLHGFFEEKGYLLETQKVILPDEQDRLELYLKEQIAEEVDLVVVTGGTGISPRDVTPEAVLNVMEKELPGLMDYIRLKYGADNFNALMSRSLAGVAGHTLLFAIPGSTRAVEEYLNEILKAFEHSYAMLKGLSH